MNSVLSARLRNAREQIPQRAYCSLKYWLRQSPSSLFVYNLAAMDFGQRTGDKERVKDKQ